MGSRRRFIPKRAAPEWRLGHPSDDQGAGWGITRRGLLASALMLPLIGCNAGAGAPAPTTSSTFAFDTYCSFTAYGDDTAPAKLAQACAHFDQLFNLYDSASDIARINAAGSSPVKVDPETAALIRRALDFCEQADGLFDITIGAVSALWDFHEGIRPMDTQIAEALTHVDWHSVAVDEAACTVTLADPLAKLDLGGIAKGYVADRLCELLQHETSATAAAISLGGNIAYFGKKPDSTPWETGVRDPNDPGGNSVIATVGVEGGSLVTSGLYERTFELDGITYWHILDPRTGYPVKTDVASVTVASGNSTEADALSTALFVAGVDGGIELVDARDDVAALFVRDDGRLVRSREWHALESA